MTDLDSRITIVEREACHVTMSQGWFGSMPIWKLRCRCGGIAPGSNYLLKGNALEVAKKHLEKTGGLTDE